MHPDSKLDTTSLLDRCKVLIPIVDAGCFYSRRTAAAIWGITVPDPPEGKIEVGAFHPARGPRRPELLTHRVPPHTVRIVRRHGLPVPTVADTWCLLAAVLDLTQLVIAGDQILTGARYFNSGGLRASPLALPDRLAQTSARYRRTRGAPLRRRALQLLRFPVDSPAETRLRLCIIQAGLPEPLVNCPVPVTGLELNADMGYPELKIAIEHEGSYHFEGGLEVARRDVERYELMLAAGWRVLRTTAIDLRHPGPFLDRLTAALRNAQSPSNDRCRVKN